MKNSLTKGIIIVFLAAAIALSGCGAEEKAVCGNNICDEGENSAICPADCGGTTNPQEAEADARTNIAPMGPSLPKQPKSNDEYEAQMKALMQGINDRLNCSVWIDSATPSETFITDDSTVFNVEVKYRGIGNCKGKKIFLTPTVPPADKAFSSEQAQSIMIKQDSIAGESGVPTEFTGTATLKGFTIPSGTSGTVCGEISLTGETTTASKMITEVFKMPPKEVCERMAPSCEYVEGGCFMDSTGALPDFCPPQLNTEPFQYATYCELLEISDALTPPSIPSPNQEETTSALKNTTTTKTTPIKAYFADSPRPSVALADGQRAVVLMESEIEIRNALAQFRYEMTDLVGKLQSGDGIRFSFREPYGVYDEFTMSITTTYLEINDNFSTKRCAESIESVEDQIRKLNIEKKRNQNQLDIENKKWVKNNGRIQELNSRIRAFDSEINALNKLLAELQEFKIYLTGKIHSINEAIIQSERSFSGLSKRVGTLENELRQRISRSCREAPTSGKWKPTKGFIKVGSVLGLAMGISTIADRMEAQEVANAKAKEILAETGIAEMPRFDDKDKTGMNPQIDSINAKVRQLQSMVAASLMDRYKKEQIGDEKIYTNTNQTTCGNTIDLEMSRIGNEIEILEEEIQKMNQQK